MKYIRTYENLYDDLIKKYKKYKDKFFIVKKQDFLINSHDIFMCKMLDVDMFMNWEEYEYDDFESAYQVINRSLHIIDFDKYYSIIKPFDNFDDMKKEYEVFKNADKYNL